MQHDIACDVARAGKSGCKGASGSRVDNDLKVDGAVRPVVDVEVGVQENLSQMVEGNPIGELHAEGASHLLEAGKINALDGTWVGLVRRRSNDRSSVSLSLVAIAGVRARHTV
jgi:hypothetical protein